MRRFLVPIGAIDGVNQLFTLPTGYIYLPGSLFIVVGGLTIPADHDNGAVETSNTSFTTKDVLQVGDALLCIIDDGTSSGSSGGADIDLSLDPLNYSLDFNNTNYLVEFNTNNHSLDFNANNYSIEFNTNSIKLGS